MRSKSFLVQTAIIGHAKIFELFHIVLFLENSYP